MTEQKAAEEIKQKAVEGEIGKQRFEKWEKTREGERKSEWCGLQRERIEKREVHKMQWRGTMSWLAATHFAT